MTPAGYQLLHVPRAHGTGGGIAVIYKSTFVMRQLDTPTAKTFDLMGLHIRMSSTALRLTPTIFVQPRNSS